MTQILEALKARPYHLEVLRGKKMNAMQRIKYNFGLPYQMADASDEEIPLSLHRFIMYSRIVLNLGSSCLRCPVLR